MITEMATEDLDVNQNFSEVSIYKRNQVFLKIEPGTPLKLLKLLCESEGLFNGEILGVKPRHSTNAISCISTLDDTRLFEKEYQLILNETKSEKDKECNECSKTKSKQLISIGVNTDFDISELSNASRNYKSLPVFTSEPPKREYLKSKVFSPPLFDFAKLSGETNHSYKALQEATKKLYSQQPGIESISYDYLPIRYRSPHEKMSNRILKISDEDITNQHKHNFDSVIKTVSGLKSPSYKHAGNSISEYHTKADERVEKQRNERNITSKKNSHLTEIQTDSPPALLRFHDDGQSRRDLFEMTHVKGEEPPVFVLPNDFDATNATADMYAKRDHHLSLSPSYMESQYSPSHGSPTMNGKATYIVTPQKLENIYNAQYDNDTKKINEKKTSPKRNYSPDSSTGSEGKLRCKICSRTFATKSLLYKHLRGHTSDEKPFKCSECGQGFTLSSNLRQHRIIHRGYKPFQCEFCGKKFMRSNVYKQHRRIHTGEEMHKCTLCPSEFLQKYALVKHMKKNHNIDASDM